MSGFLTKRITLTATITQVVAAEEFDRVVLMTHRAGTINSLVVGFDSSGDEADVTDLLSSALLPASIPLPQGVELWVRDAGFTTPGTIDIIVTR